MGEGREAEGMGGCLTAPGGLPEKSQSGRETVPEQERSAFFLPKASGPLPSTELGRSGAAFSRVFIISVFLPSFLGFAFPDISGLHVQPVKVSVSGAHSDILLLSA